MTRAGRDAAMEATPQFRKAVSAPWTSAAGSASDTTRVPARGVPPASQRAAAAASAHTAAQASSGAGTCQASGRRCERPEDATATTVSALVIENDSVSAPSRLSASAGGGAGARRLAAASQGSVTMEVDHGSSVPTPSTKKHADSRCGLGGARMQSRGRAHLRCAVRWRSAAYAAESDAPRWRWQGHRGGKRR